MRPKPVIGEDRKILADDRETEVYFMRDGAYVRTPGSDAVRIPRGGRVFLEVNELNERIDGQPEGADQDLHSRANDKFTTVYIPPMFKLRISIFVFLVWLFAAATGIIFTVVPLIIGRQLLQPLCQNGTPPNDLYAFTTGVCLYATLGGLWLISQHCWAQIRSVLDSSHDTPTIKTILSRLSVQIFSIIYAATIFGVVLPLLLSTIFELYVTQPAYLFFLQRESQTSDLKIPEVKPRIFLVQIWVTGLLYERFVIRRMLRTRAAGAMRAIVRDGYHKPDARLATRALILPAIVVSTVLLTLPFACGKAIIQIFDIKDHDHQVKTYRNAFPILLAILITIRSGAALIYRIHEWRIMIRDEVYLIGEKLHNFGEAAPKTLKIDTSIPPQ